MASHHLRITSSDRPNVKKNMKISGMSPAYTTPCYNSGSHTLKSLSIWSM